MEAEAWIGAIGGGVGGLAGMASVAVSIAIYRANRRSDRENREVAERAAAAAEASAESARLSAGEAATVARMEVDREHRSLSPMKTTIRFEGERDQRTGLWNVFAVLEAERCYRVRGEAVLDSRAIVPLGLPLLLRARMPIRVHLEQLPEGRQSPLARKIVIRAWPPNAELDDVEEWTCRCGKPVNDGDGTLEHWKIELPVDYKQPVTPES